MASQLPLRGSLQDVNPNQKLPSWREGSSARKTVRRTETADGSNHGFEAQHLYDERATAKRGREVRRGGNFPRNIRFLTESNNADGSNCKIEAPRRSPRISPEIIRENESVGPGARETGWRECGTEQLLPPL